MSVQEDLGAAKRAAKTDGPLVVDMDGTLLATDMSLENICWVAGHAFRSLFWIPLWATKGRSHLKAKLADAGVPPSANLPYNQECLDLIAKARSAGTKTVLASASDERIVEDVARTSGLFDEWYGSSATRNLAGQEKANLLVEKFGEKGFDYVGDGAADLKVWPRANKAYSLGASIEVRRSLDACHDRPIHMRPLPRRVAWTRAHFLALRPHQWAKNLLMFVPLLASHQLGAQHILLAALAFVAFSLLASSVYVVNDLIDLASDRAHPRKSRRPFAAGTVSIRDGLAMAPLLLLTSILLSLLFLPPLFLAVLGVYYLATVLYSFWLKQKVLIDIGVLAGLYTLRIIAGGVATGIESSRWLLAFSMFFFFALAVVKRQAELVDLIKSNDTRELKRGYRIEDLHVIQSFGAASGYVSVLVMALYFNSIAAGMLYKSPMALWLICPLMLYWISRMLLLGTRGQMHDDPIVFAMKDYVSYLVGICITLVVAASLFI